VVKEKSKGIEKNGRGGLVGWGRGTQVGRKKGAATHEVSRVKKTVGPMLPSNFITAERATKKKAGVK